LYQHYVALTFSQGPFSLFYLPQVNWQSILPILSSVRSAGRVFLNPLAGRIEAEVMDGQIQAIVDEPVTLFSSET